MAMSSVFCATCAPVAIGTGGAGAIVVVVDDGVLAAPQLLQKLPVMG